MFKRFRKTLATAAAALALVAIPAMAPVGVSAQTSATSDPLKCGTTLKVDSTGACDISQGTTGINNIITNIVNIFSIIVGIVSVIMIIYGGFRYVTSGGDSGNVTSAKNTIIYAVVGLVVVALAQFIVQFVLDKVSTAA
jgi:hypothetical protein